VALPGVVVGLFVEDRPCRAHAVIG
jgi:hypothetical protein